MAGRGDVQGLVWIRKAGIRQQGEVYRETSDLKVNFISDFGYSRPSTSLLPGAPTGHKKT